MKHSESIAKLAAALVASQNELKAVGKDAVNPHFRNHYASLDAIIEAVRPVLAKNRLAVMQGANTPVTDEAGQLCGFAVETMLVHESGEWVLNAAIMPLAKVDPQGAGGAMTYGRRYGLSALLALATEEDDDGNHASNRPPAAGQLSNGAPSVKPTTKPKAVAPIEERAPLDEAPAPQTAADPDCPKCGGQMWDNRISKKNPKAPDYKCRSRSCDGVVWPPKPAVRTAPDLDEQEMPWERDD